MNRAATALVLVSVTAALSGCGGPFDDIAGADRVTLYSLDGFGPAEIDSGKRPTPGGTLHGFGVLGTVDLDQADGERILGALNDGLEGAHAEAACFLPRHAIRVERGRARRDYVVCFECLRYGVYENGERVGHGLITEVPQPVLDRILEGAGVPLAPKVFSKEWDAAYEAAVSEGSGRAAD